MRARRWISIFALFGVLLHAGAIVRHNAAMTGAALQYQALVTGLAELCHGSGTARRRPQFPICPTFPGHPTRKMAAPSARAIFTSWPGCSSRSGVDFCPASS